jgi:AcrR family transcriptional regulator
MPKSVSQSIKKTTPLELPETKFDLKDACVVAAHAVIAEHGIEKLSLRDVARTLNVSHQAPYKHYPSRDHLLAEVIRRCFKRFSIALNARERSADPREDMCALGLAYLAFAMQNPLEYRLMFGTPWPEEAAHAEMLTEARHAFDVLREALQPMFKKPKRQKQSIDAAAMFVWSTMHGLASIMKSQAIHSLELDPKFLETAQAQVMAIVDLALTAHTDAVNGNIATGTKSLRN